MEHEIELDLMNLIVKVPKQTVILRIEAEIYDNKELKTVHAEMDLPMIREARQDFLDNVEAGDDYDAIYEITEEGKRYLDELQSE